MITHKEISANFLVIIICLIVAVSAGVIMLPKIMNSKTELTIGRTIFKSTIGLNEVDRLELLTQTDDLSGNNSTILAYIKPQKLGVDLRNSKKPIDIVWLDQTKKVVHITSSVSASTNKLQRVASNVSAKYIIILPPGSVASGPINLGETLIFQIDEAKIE